MEIKNVGIVGAGLMGTGIAQVASTAGYKVTLVDLSEEILNKSVSTIEGFLEKKVNKGKMNKEDKEKFIGNINPSNNMNALASCQLIIEAVPEDFEIKKAVFNKLVEIASPECILASNTSSLSITRISGLVSGSERVIGMHFFYPAPLMKLVELIRTVTTSDETYQTCLEVCKKMGKEPVDAPDYPGFLVNRLLTPFMNEAIYCVMEGASPEDVDKAMKLGANLPMGPLELADFVGLDTLLKTQLTLYEGYKDSKYRPCPLLQNMVEAGLLGRKTGRGFYSY